MRSSPVVKTVWQSKSIHFIQSHLQLLICIRYDGYNKDLIDRFGSMGFDVERVVAAFRFVGAERNGGRDYQLDEGKMADITGRLLGE